MKTIEDYIKASRILLQDVSGHRYSDEELRLGLALSFIEAQRIRPDMFLKIAVPDLMAVPVTTEVPSPPGYQTAFMYYMCGHVQLRDDEDTTDSRASVFLNKFVSQLLATAS